MWRLRSQDSRRSFQRCLGDLRNRGPGGEGHQHDRPASPAWPVGRKRGPAGRRCARGPRVHALPSCAMDLTYPPEAEQFRAEIRAWLEENLPQGWGEEDFSMTPEERKAFNIQWVKKLHAGGWICASWPTEYGGKGLSLMEQVVLNEEFAKAKAPLRADFFGDTLVGPDDPAVGHRGAEADLHPPDTRRARSPGARDSPSPTPEATSPRSRPGRSSTATNG